MESKSQESDLLEQVKQSHAHAEAEAHAHDECRKLLEQAWEEVAREAVGHLRDMLMQDDGQAYKEAQRFIDTNFPTPAPEPVPFDWEGLWAELPSWIQWVAMDSDTEWWGHAAEPKPTGHFSVWEDADLLIPPEFAPPPCADWRESLVQRPTQTSPKP